MSFNIYPMPPVAYGAAYIDREEGIAVSNDAQTGVEIRSAFGPVRRIIAVTIIPLALNRSGAGYMASLADLLAGVHFVRLRVPPVNWHVDRCANRGSAGLFGGPLIHTDDDDVFPIEDAVEDVVVHFHPNATPGTAATVGGFPALNLSGLTPGRLVCRAYDVIRSYTGTTSNGTARALSDVYAAADGTATIKLHSTLTGGVISIGDDEEVVCRAIEKGVSDQPVGEGWTFRWLFREALPAEFSTASEVNPW